MRSINPATGQTIRDYVELDAAEVERRLARADAAFARWRSSSFSDRATALSAVAARLRSQRDRLARLITEEMGKPIAQSEAEVEKCAWVCEHYAEHAESYLAPETIATDAERSYVRHDPLGVLLAVMPWNFPFWQAFRATAPALMAGNVVVLKHASNVPGSALAIEELFRADDVPDDIFTTLLIPAAAAEALAEHPLIDAVTLTGSEAAGIALARRAGSALKKTVLELGGSDPFIVLADADPDQVAKHAAAARIINGGQSCIAAKRFIVEAPIASRFEDALVAAMAALRVGDPMDRSNHLGPMARPDLVDELERQVEGSVRLGAVLAHGGGRLSGPGNYYTPTVLTRVTPGMPVFDQETFGPVAAVALARDSEHALELANASRFGLGASLWTRDPKRAERLVIGLEAGAVFVNGAVKSDPRLPFGGIKRSGYGRELSSVGIREFVNVKTVWIG